MICSFGSESHCKDKDDDYLGEITFYLSSINLKKIREIAYRFTKLEMSYFSRVKCFFIFSKG